MSCAAIGVGGAALIGAGVAAAGGLTAAEISSNAAGNAANTQAGAANYATQVQQQEFQQQQQNQQPWLNAGASALSQMQNPAFQQNFNTQDFQQDPGYQFDLQQGQLALSRSAAAQGGLQSGGFMKGMAQYTQGMASNEYQNAYNRFQQNKTTNFNQLASLAGLGQTASGQVGQAGENMANNVGNIATSNANAQGAASIAQGNLWGGAINNGINAGANAGMMSSMANRYAPQQPATGGPSMGSQALMNGPDGAYDLSQYQ